MIKLDLEEIGIPFETPSERADFHSLRAVYATQLARKGVNLQSARALTRHSTVELTAKTYTKLGIADLGEVVRSLSIPKAVAGQEKVQGE